MKSLALFVGLALSGAAHAQHQDVLAYNDSGKVGVGQYDFDNLETTTRTVFTAQFPSTYADNDPGFSANPGPLALPGRRDLMWDFLPMRVGSHSSALFHWNGAGSSPTFTPTPTPAYGISLFGSSGTAVASGGVVTSPVAGGTVARTGTNGSIHQHLFYFLDDNGDGTNSTLPASGVYLIAMRLRIDGLQTSDPFYMLWATPGVPTATLAAAEPWVSARAALLTDLAPPTLAGDFNADGVVNAADYTAWRDTVGSQVAFAADADRSREVDAGDYAAWSANYGASAVALRAIPEPNTLALCAALLAGCVPRRLNAHGLQKNIDCI
ncbi:MAG: hypothetical protein ACRCT8_17970 [Lacipirellulaceae bacterium]